mmetsp:Transcript_35478/g.55241  ORF Transcript_35478/g.55241 Transcript_35478/m.55241 type:complete len:211 (+) Transcript_35478:287-919(+)
MGIQEHSLHKDIHKVQPQHRKRQPNSIRHGRHDNRPHLVLQRPVHSKPVQDDAKHEEYVNRRFQPSQTSIRRHRLQVVGGLVVVHVGRDLIGVLDQEFKADEHQEHDEQIPDDGNAVDDQCRAADVATAVAEEVVFAAGGGGEELGEKAGAAGGGGGAGGHHAAAGSGHWSVGGTFFSGGEGEELFGTHFDRVGLGWVVIRYSLIAFAES